MTRVISRMCIVFAGLIFSAYASAEPPDVSCTDALRKLAKSWQWVDNSVVEATIEVSNLSGEKDATPKKAMAHPTVRYVSSSSQLRIDRLVPGFGWFPECLFTGKEAMRWEGPGHIRYTSSPQTYQKWWTDFSHLPVGGWFLDGIIFVAGEPEALRIANLGDTWHLDARAGREKVDEIDCIVVKALKPDVAEAVMWLDPASGYLPVRYAVKSIGKQTAANGWYTLVDQMKAEQREGNWVVVAGRCTQQRMTAGGEVQSGALITSVNRTKFVFSPDFDAMRAFDPSCIRDGTGVYISLDDPVEEKRQSSLRHEWKAGKPVLNYDPELVNRIREQVESSKHQ